MPTAKMMVICVVAVIFLAASSFSRSLHQRPAPQDTSQMAIIKPGFLGAESYLKLGSDAQSLYATGILDGMYLAPVFDAPNNDKHLAALQTCTKGMTKSQIAAIAVKFGKANPEKWNEGANILIYQALWTACQMN
jgi:hypothetical protein